MASMIQPPTGSDRRLRARTAAPGRLRRFVLLLLVALGLLAYGLASFRPASQPMTIQLQAPVESGPAREAPVATPPGRGIPFLDLYLDLRGPGSSLPTALPRATPTDR